MGCNAHHFLLALLCVQVHVVGCLRIFERPPDAAVDPKNQKDAPQADQYPYALVVAADPGLKKELKIALRSVIKNRNTEFSIYLFVLQNHAKNFSSFTDVDGTPVTLKYFSKADVDPYINKAWKFHKFNEIPNVDDGTVDLAKSENEYSPHLDNPYNYVRYIMAERIPEHQGLVWMDTDMIATVDIMKDMEEFLKSNKTIGAFPRMDNTIHKKVIDKMKETSHLPLQHLPHFNAGFFYMSTTQYNKENCSKDVQNLVALNNKHKWYVYFGSQPPLTLLFGGPKLFKLHSFKQVNGLGTKKMPHLDKTKGILHWNGEKKPWKAEGLNKGYWEQYAHAF